MSDDRTATAGVAPVAVPAPAPGRPRRVRRWAVGSAVCVLALTGAGFATAAAVAGTGQTAQARQDFSTAPIQDGTLSGTRTASGTLDYIASRDLGSGIDGVLTGAPAAGSQIGNGQVLYSVNNVGVFLFHGKLPAWRALEAGMSDNADVRQLEEALQALGYFTGQPDEEFDRLTMRAIKLWQGATGQPETGRIELGRIVFAATDLRIAEVKGAIGDRVGGGPVLKVSGLTKEISSQLKLADQGLAAIGQKVQIRLPGGATTTGTVASVGQPTEKDNNGQPSVVIPVTITLDDPAAVDGLQRASVTVDFPSETREGVLSVPLEALMVLPDGSFGVEIVRADGTTARVPVKTGLFAGGRVEIAGDDVQGGVDVVVPKQ